MDLGVRRQTVIWRDVMRGQQQRTSAMRVLFEQAKEAFGRFRQRFGDDPGAPPRYCHQVSEAEFERWPGVLGLEPVDRYNADGAEGDLNRYWILRKA